jgi:hypothetical protein
VQTPDVHDAGLPEVDPGITDMPHTTMALPDMNDVAGHDDLLLVTLDTLRFDVAAELTDAGRIPNQARHLPGGAWEKRHAPGSFTYASHQAMFAGLSAHSRHAGTASVPVRRALRRQRDHRRPHLCIRRPRPGLGARGPRLPHGEQPSPLLRHRLLRPRHRVRRDGFTGHRLGHEAIWTVPYAHFFLKATA